VTAQVQTQTESGISSRAGKGGMDRYVVLVCRGRVFDVVLPKVSRRRGPARDGLASSHACPASKDTHARASADHHAGGDMASILHANCSHGQASKQSINTCNQHGKASRACMARGGGTSTWHPRCPSMIRAVSAHINVRTDGAALGARGPTRRFRRGCGHCWPCGCPRARPCRPHCLL